MTTIVKWLYWPAVVLAPSVPASGELLPIKPEKEWIDLTPLAKAMSDGELGVI